MNVKGERVARGTKYTIGSDMVERTNMKNKE